MHNELIEILWYCGQGKGCKECPLWDKPSKACFEASNDAADALEAADKRIAELEAKIPKEGEWRGLIIDGQYWAITCSNCHQVGFNARTPYCPNCGARMRVEHDEH